MDEKLNIYQRLNQVAKNVDYLKKDDVITLKGGSYTAITHDAVTAAVRGELIEQGVKVVPQVEKHWQEEMRTFVDLRVFFVCEDNPSDYIAVTGFGYGDDYGDKGPGKAQSYAIKNIYLKLFMIETGESDESRIPIRGKGLTESILDLSETIHTIKAALGEKDLGVAAEAWFELSKEEKESIWVAPSKGGPFTTKERTIMQSAEFRQAHYGDDNAEHE